MGKQRITDEERVVTYFTSASADKAVTMLNIIKSIVANKLPKPVKQRKTPKTDDHRTNDSASQVGSGG